MAPLRSLWEHGMQKWLCGASTSLLHKCCCSVQVLLGGAGIVNFRFGGGGGGDIWWKY